MAAYQTLDVWIAEMLSVQKETQWQLSLLFHSLHYNVLGEYMNPFSSSYELNCLADWVLSLWLAKTLGDRNV